MTTKEEKCADQFERNAKCIVRGNKRIHNNRRYLKWFGWFPLSFEVRDANEELLAARRELVDADDVLRRRYPEIAAAHPRPALIEEAS
jgi:hypothetical protein